MIRREAEIAEGAKQWRALHFAEDSRIHNFSDNVSINLYPKNLVELSYHGGEFSVDCHLFDENGGEIVSCAINLNHCVSQWNRTANSFCFNERKELLYLSFMNNHFFLNNVYGIEDIPVLKSRTLAHLQKISALPTRQAREQKIKIDL